MDKDKVKGTIDDTVGRAKRQIGEWTNDPKLQVEGTAQQIKGKVEKISGNVKDAVRDATKPKPANDNDTVDTVQNDRATTSNRR